MTWAIHHHDSTKSGSNTMQAAFHTCSGMQIYALSFFLIPALRWVSNTAKNRVIEARNDSRASAAKALRTPSRELQRKLDR